MERYLSKNGMNGLYVRNDQLCASLAGNAVPLVTVTNISPKEQLIDRKIVLLCARVHPGENNSSWIMHGALFFVIEKLVETQIEVKFDFSASILANLFLFWKKRKNYILRLQYHKCIRCDFVASSFFFFMLSWYFICHVV